MLCRLDKHRSEKNGKVFELFRAIIGGNSRLFERKNEKRRMYNEGNKKNA